MMAEDVIVRLVTLADAEHLQAHCLPGNTVAEVRAQIAGILCPQPPQASQLPV